MGNVMIYTDREYVNLAESDLIKEIEKVMTHANVQNVSVKMAEVRSAKSILVDMRDFGNLSPSKATDLMDSVAATIYFAWGSVTLGKIQIIMHTTLTQSF